MTEFSKNEQNKKLDDNDYYKSNLKENDATKGCLENANDEAKQGVSSYGREEKLYSEKLLKRQLRQHFITIPQTTQDFNEIHENLITASKNIKYVLTAKELHEDGGTHYHMVITGTTALYVSTIHKKILEISGDIKGSINYQAVKSIKASVNYCKKDGQYLEYGTHAKQGDGKSEAIKKVDKVCKEILENDKTTEENIEYIKQEIPSYWIQYSEQITTELLSKQTKNNKRWKPKKWTTENTSLRPYQTTIWKMIQHEPKSRRIIWVSGRANSGKSFMFNYIDQNYEYGIYSAGSTASLDNASYGYNGEGAIAWDIPMNYDFETYGDALASTIEKFSDYGQNLTSKKYKGKKIQALGHVIVFSNHPPLKQLAHRDIIHIKTNQGESKEKQLKEAGVKLRVKNDKQYWEITTKGLLGDEHEHYTQFSALPQHIQEIYNN